MPNPPRGILRSMERGLETAIFRSRWLLAPFYLGLIVSLFLLLYCFVHELVEFVPTIPHAKSGVVVTNVLGLVDIVMVANLILLIVFAGYENFVSKIDTRQSEDRPDWMGLVTFADLKIKLMGTIVADFGDRSSEDVHQREILHGLRDRLAHRPASDLRDLRRSVCGDGSYRHAQVQPAGL